MSLFGVAAALAAFGSYYGVARAAETRSARLTFLYRADLHPLVVIAIVVAAIVLVGLRLTVARELFPVPDPQLWAPFGRSMASWTVALIVASMVLVVALRASARPLTRFGERRVVAALAGLGNLELVASVLVIAVGLGVAAATGQRLLPTEWLAAIPVAKFVGVALLAILMLLPMFRGTAARWIGLSSAVFLLSTTSGGALTALGVTPPDIAATPVQVLILLLLAALALGLWNLCRRDQQLNPSLVARLAVVPLIAVHAGWLLPAAWSGLGRVVVVIAVVLALFWFMPPVAADRTRHALHVVSASTAQLLALVIFTLAIPSLFSDGALTVLGLLWLSVPVIAALTIDTKPGAREVAASR